MNPKIAVIGAGIVGTTSALALIESIPNIDITIISDQFTPNTTGDGSGGLIYPYLPGKTAPEKINKWVRDSMRYFKDLFKSPNAGRLGIGLLSMYMLFEDNQDIKIASEAQEMIACRPLTAEELDLFPKKWKSGAFVTTYFAECTKLLPQLLQTFKSKGGKVLQKKVKNLEEMIGKYDIVINCTGVEAFNCVNDKKVQPIRGQVFRVDAPWIKHCVMAGDYYIIPNSETVILGGTKQVNDWNQEVDPKDSADIMEGCSQLYPSVKSAKIIREWVGLRPGRETVRLEKEVINNLNHRLYVVHNYGHGGSGVTLAYGCAQEVLQNVREIINENLRSKL